MTATMRVERREVGRDRLSGDIEILKPPVRALSALNSRMQDRAGHARLASTPTEDRE
jgi:hypothetical protein